MELSNSFKRNCRDALVEDMMGKLDEGPDALVNEAVEKAHGRLRGWGDERGYNVESVIESLQEPELTREANVVSVTYGWEHEAAPHFEYGTPDNYEIDGNPILSFVWSGENVPRWVKKEFDREGDGYRVFFSSVDSGRGIAETRFVRTSLEWLRQEVSK